jgi:hypothetical protein
MLLSDMAGAANQAVRVRGNCDDQRVARPCRQMCVQGSDRGVGPAREHKIEETDVTSLALRQTDSRVLGCPQGHPCCRDVALSHQYLGLTGVGQGKNGVGGDGSVIGLGCAGVESQRQIGGLNVGIPRGSGRSG